MFCDKHMARTNVTFYFLMPCPGLGSAKASDAWQKRSGQRFLWAAMFLTWPFPLFFQADKNGLAQDSSKWAPFRAIQRIGWRETPALCYQGSALTEDVPEIEFGMMLI